MRSAGKHSCIVTNLTNLGFWAASAKFFEFRVGLKALGKNLFQLRCAHCEFSCVGAFRLNVSGIQSRTVASVLRSSLMRFSG